jgi:hypothetical protein
VTELIRVYVNERALDVPPGTVVSAAVAALDPGLGAAVAEGRAYVTDGRGIRLGADAPLTAGAILRVVRPAKHPAANDDQDDAHP